MASMLPDSTVGMRPLGRQSVGFASPHPGGLLPSSARNGRKTGEYTSQTRRCQARTVSLTAQDRTEMGDSTQIGFCTPGLRLTFSRDLAQKYTRYWDLTKEEEEKQTSRPPPTEPENTWQVTGYFDFLQVSEFKRLDDLKKVLPEVEKLVSWRSFRDLVLVPFADQPVPKDFTKRLTSPAKDASERNLLLAVIEMTLSPALFEFEPKSPTRTFEAIRHTIGVLEGWIKEQREAAPQEGQGTLPVVRFRCLLLRQSKWPRRRDAGSS